jgi:hypothetical protein
MAFKEAAVVAAPMRADRVQDLPLVGTRCSTSFKFFLASGTRSRRAIAFADAPIMIPRQVNAKEALVQGRAAMLLRNQYLITREYAHSRRPDWAEGSRVDFAETIYWNAGIRTDASTGVASVSFHLSDSVTSFRVLADGVAKMARSAQASAYRIRAAILHRTEDTASDHQR